MKLVSVDGVYKMILENSTHYAIQISCTITINPTPSDATVTFSTGTVSGKSCTVTDGTSVTYTVSKTGYVTKTATLRVTKSKTINVTLVEGHYQVDEVVYESSTAGSTTFNLLDSGKYEVICIAGGGGGKQYYMDGKIMNYGGGSGSGFDCVLQLTSGNYNIVVGAAGARNTSQSSTTQSGSGGNSQFGTSYAYGGGGASWKAVGTKGSAPSVTYTIVSTTFNKAGNAGTSDIGSTAAGGASVYDNTATGYGAGGRSNQNGYVGYVKVIYKGT